MQGELGLSKEEDGQNDQRVILAAAFLCSVGAQPKQHLVALYPTFSGERKSCSISPSIFI